MRSARFFSTIRTESDPQELALQAKTLFFLSLISYYVAVHFIFCAFFSNREKYIIFAGYAQRCADHDANLNQFDFASL